MRLTSSTAKAVEEPAVKKTEKVVKRKATEESSPVASKKQKAVKVTATKSKKPATEPTPVAVKETKKVTKKTKSKPVEEPEEEEEEEKEVAEETEISLVPEDEEGSGSGSDDNDEIDEEIQALAAGLDPENDDGAVGDGPAYQPGQDMGKIPKLSKQEKKALAAKKSAAKKEPGVIYVGRIPHGFYEHALRSYFSQFGSVTRLRMARNKRTGASKHFAFIEFADESTAIIAAKTMDGYLLYNHILKVKTVPRDQLHEDVWKGANRRFKKTPWAKIEGNKLARPLTEAGWEKRISKESSKRLGRAKKLKAIGYEFEVPALKAPPPPPAVEAQAEPAAVEEGEKQKVVEEAPVADPKETNGDAQEDEAPVAAPKAKGKKGAAKKGKKAKA